MANRLRISVGQHSDKGRKAVNQDFHGVYRPQEPLLGAKGIAIALADGIGSSAVSQVASEAAVSGFLADYFCTPEAWTVKKSAQRVLEATNSWLHAQTRQSQHRYDMDRGYVCTFSAMVIKSTTAYVFHAGDARIYRLRGGELEQLTNDHRLFVSQDKSYLSRALGVHPHLEIDYRALPVEQGDVFLFVTDGVHEHASPCFMVEAIQAHADDLDRAAQAISAEAYAQGSADNLTTQIVRVDALPGSDAHEVHRQLGELALPPLLDARMVFDGYRIIRELHASSRSHVYLAVDGEGGPPVVLKTPSLDLRGDPAYLERFLMEEWIARRIDSAHVLKACPPSRRRRYLYTVSEFVEGRTLTQWLIDHPQPDLQAVRGIVEQIAKGLRAFHRLEMLHQDLRPDNVLIDATGTVKIIDFGSTRVAGICEMSALVERGEVLGTAQYSAPEYFLGEGGTTRSDLFSLGVIAYQMLTGRLPYGPQVARIKRPADRDRLQYHTAREINRAVPAWIDEVLRKAVHPLPHKRYGELSEFVYDLRQPSQAFLERSRPPLLERNPLLFWKSVSLLLLIVIAVLALR
ncbi:Serine/threonine-protein kinase PknD [compost metagenome]